MVIIKQDFFNIEIDWFYFQSWELLPIGRGGRSEQAKGLWLFGVLVACPVSLAVKAPSLTQFMLLEPIWNTQCFVL